MLWAKYPNDHEILSVGIKGLYIGNFFPWDPNQHTKMIKKNMGGLKPKSLFKEPIENLQI